MYYTLCYSGLYHVIVYQIYICKIIDYKNMIDRYVIYNYIKYNINIPIIYDLHCINIYITYISLLYHISIYICIIKLSFNIRSMDIMVYIVIV